jgi:putative copper export protein
MGQLGVLAPMVERFSRVAFWSVMILAATGVTNALLHLGPLGNLISTDYGRTLMARLCAFGGIISLGAINHFVMRQRLWAGLRAGEPVKEQALLRRSVAIEVALAALVLGATAVLVGLPPPSEGYPT